MIYFSFPCNKGKIFRMHYTKLKIEQFKKGEMFNNLLYFYHEILLNEK